MKRSANCDTFTNPGRQFFPTRHHPKRDCNSKGRLFWSIAYSLSLPEERRNSGCVGRHLAKSDSFKALRVALCLGSCLGLINASSNHRGQCRCLLSNCIRISATSSRRETKAGSLDCVRDDSPYGTKHYNSQLPGWGVAVGGWIATSPGGRTVLWATRHG